MKSERELSTNNGISTVEYWGSSLIEVIFIDYQTSKL